MCPFVIGECCASCAYRCPTGTGSIPFSMPALYVYLYSYKSSAPVCSRYYCTLYSSREGRSARDIRSKGSRAVSRSSFADVLSYKFRHWVTIDWCMPAVERAQVARDVRSVIKSKMQHSPIRRDPRSHGPSRTLKMRHSEIARQQGKIKVLFSPYTFHVHVLTNLGTRGKMQRHNLLIVCLHA